MQADADFQVWLASEANARQSVIAPMVQSRTDRQVSYRVAVVQDSKGGTSRISQSGVLNLEAARAAGLSRFVLRPAPDGVCWVELVLSDQGGEIGTYRFACPR